ncbi:unnamed protein product [Meganyctiphanes norvegica]|uniref:Metalloendopeptidase n=1 Tax=Meganyctiphanes norvegica TaxID=48144 RepID=A0AAV2PUM2_MEGNR
MRTAVMRSGTMRAVVVFVLVLLLCKVGTAQDDIEEEQEEPPQLTALPDVLIGDPNDVAADDIGLPITDEEFAAALADPSLLTFRSDDIDDEVSPLANQTTHFQGDIQIQNEDQFYELMLNNETNGQSSAISNPSLKWPNNEIPYYISSYFYGTERAVIVRAMAEYHKETCLKFVPRTTQRDYVHILKGQGCSSSVGRVGGVQTVSLGYGCVHLGTAIHELMHAAGFWHEQSRYDRDSFVTINYNNIIPGLAYNFNRKTRSVTQDLGLPYDYKSVMHYDQYAFAWNRRIPTLYPRQNGAQILGQRSGFSELDKMGLNLLYQCSGKPNPKPSGCTDSNRYCPDWARKGQCNVNTAYMHVYCKKSCDKCDKTVKPDPKPSPCVDQNQYCKDWAANGHCVSNAGYMKVGCKKSCNLCGTTKPTNCVDNNKYCADWASKGQCQSNAAYMKVGCPKSCKTCGEIIFPDQCVDTNAFCPDWSLRGYCQANPSYMHVSCRKSCNKCSSITTTSTTTTSLTTTTTTTVPSTTMPTEESTEAPHRGTH